MSIPVNKYPYTDLHEMNMDWVLEKIKELIDAWVETKGEWDDTKIAWSQTQEAWTDLYNYVHDYFDNLDVQAEVNAKIDELVSDGTMQTLVNNAIAGLIIDAVPTGGSTNLVTSGGVYDSLPQNWGDYSHNGFYRGKNLGEINSITDADDFVAAHGITIAEFNDLFLGDYIKINDGQYNGEWMVAGFDWFIHKGYPNIFTDPHVVLISKSILLDNINMNPSATTTGGYNSSDMATSSLPFVANKLQAVLGTHLKSFPYSVSNAVSGGKASGNAILSAYVMLPCENDLMDTQFFGNNNDAGFNNQKFPIFNFITPSMYETERYWLRTVASATQFAIFDVYGNVSYENANSTSDIGVRPYIILG